MLQKIALRIAILGNGDISRRHAHAIEDHDLVIHFNAARHFKTITRKIDALLIARDAVIGMHGFKRKALEVAREIWIPSGTPDLTSTDRPTVRIPEISEDYGAFPHSQPSNGLRVTRYMLNAYPGARINLYGFSHEGWEGHDWDAEKRWFDAMQEQGKVTLHVSVLAQIKREVDMLFLRRKMRRWEQMKKREATRLLSASTP